MIRNVVRAVSARLAASLAALLLLLAPALAADRALIDMLGYSTDGAYFAFEEFGVGDGSGIPFSTIYIVDLVNDKWVGNSPIAFDSQDEEQPVADVRAATLAKAKSALDKYKIGVPVQTLALIGDGAAENSGKRISWSTPSCCGPGQTQDDAFSLILSTRGTTSDEAYCADMSPVGYNLSFEDQDGVRELHTDGDKLPASRRCTLDYRLYAVVQPFQDFYADGFTSRRVAIVSTFPYGFEGVDRRFLAVPIDR